MWPKQRDLLVEVGFSTPKAYNNPRANRERYGERKGHPEYARCLRGQEILVDSPKGAEFVSGFSSDKGVISYGRF